MSEKAPIIEEPKNRVEDMAQAPIPPKKEKFKGKIEVHLGGEVPSEIVDIIWSMEQDLFPGNIQADDREEVKENLESSDGITILAHNESGEFVGYISSEPYEEAFKILSGEDGDPGMDKPEEVAEKMGKTIYLESTAVLVPRKGTLSSMMEKFIQEARGRDYTHIIMHARTTNGCSHVMTDEEKLGIKVLTTRPVENWWKTGETYDYLVIDIRQGQQGQTAETTPKESVA